MRDDSVAFYGKGALFLIHSSFLRLVQIGE